MPAKYLSLSVVGLLLLSALAGVLSGVEQDSVRENVVFTFGAHFNHGHDEDPASHFLTSGAGGYRTLQGELKQHDTAHFRIFYETEGSKAVTLSFAQRVGDLLENAYAQMITRDGFRRPLREPVEVFIETGGGGWATVVTLEGGLKQPQIGIGKDAGSGPLGEKQLDAVLVHELFHIVQFSYGVAGGPPSHLGAWWVEAMASWAMLNYASFVEEIQRHYVNSWSPDADRGGLMDRSYDASVFWVYLIQKHGGLPVVREMLNLVGNVDDLDLVQEALRRAGQTVSLSDAFQDFATTFVTGDYPISGAVTPFPIGMAEIEWSGYKATQSTITKNLTERVAGSPLQIVNKQGVAFVVILVRSTQTLMIRLTEQVVGSIHGYAIWPQGTVYQKTKISGLNPVVLSPPEGLFVWLALTRWDSTDGRFNVTISTPEKLATNLKLESPHSFAIQGKTPLALNAQLAPSLSVGTITIQYTLDNKTWQQVTQSTPSKGALTHSWTPNFEARISIRALYSGTDVFQSSQSNLLNMRIFPGNFEEQISENPVLKEQVRSLTQEVSTLKNQVNTLTQEKNALSQKASDLQAEVSKLKAERDSFEGERNLLTKERDTLLKEKTQLSQDLTAKTGQVSNLESQLSQSNQQVQRLTQEKGSLETFNLGLTVAVIAVGAVSGLSLLKLRRKP